MTVTCLTVFPQVPYGSIGHVFDPFVIPVFVLVFRCDTASHEFPLVPKEETLASEPRFMLKVLPRRRDDKPVARQPRSVDLSLRASFELAAFRADSILVFARQLIDAIYRRRVYLELGIVGSTLTSLVVDSHVSSGSQSTLWR